MRPVFMYYTIVSVIVSIGSAPKVIKRQALFLQNHFEQVENPYDTRNAYNYGQYSHGNGRPTAGFVEEMRVPVRNLLQILQNNRPVPANVYTVNPAVGNSHVNSNYFVRLPSRQTSNQQSFSLEYPAQSSGLSGLEFINDGPSQPDFTGYEVTGTGDSRDLGVGGFADFNSFQQLSEPEIGHIRLGHMNVYTDDVTISGFSSGGAFVQQLLVSHPSMFKGIGIFQQTFYRCGGGGGVVADFDFYCTNLPSNYTQERIPDDPQNSINDIGQYFQEGLIEDPRNLQNKRIYIYSGLRNEVFTIEMMMKIIQVFEPFVNNPDVIKTRVQDSQNLLPTVNFGRPCIQPATENFLIGDCDLNGAHEALSFLLGPERIKRPGKMDTYDSGSFVTFDQTEFFEGIKGPHFMADLGFAYIPRRCNVQQQHSKCLFHAYYHGCRTGSDYVGTNHIRNSGYLELAELNSIVMIFPQIKNTTVNFLGCWDSFGNTGPNYATQQGAQIIITRRMMERVIGTRSNDHIRNRQSRNACSQTDYSNLYLCQ